MSDFPETTLFRADGRRDDELRVVSLHRDFAPAAPGSVLVRVGNTEVICAVSIEENVPRWMRQQRVPGGWITAEYSMLPYSTEDRSSREVNAGKQSGRTQEIQRLIGRSLRAVVNLKDLGPRTLWVDCDVLRADGGTRTASITGSFVALRLAVNTLLRQGKLMADPIVEEVAAVSVGLVDGRPMLDLCYTEDVAAHVDMNVVMSASGKMVEVQGTAEEAPFTRNEFNALLDLAEKGIADLVGKQREALESTT